MSAINENIESQDTNIFLSALSLKLEGCLDESLEILAEIVNPSNYNSLKNIGVMSVIMSNKIISLFMVQVLTHPGSKKFYRDIISTNDNTNSDSIDIELIKAEQVIKFMSDSITFDTKAELVQSFYLSSNEKMMCIGYIKNGSTQFNFLCDKMDENESITINKDDELIIVTY